MRITVGISIVIAAMSWILIRFCGNPDSTLEFILPRGFEGLIILHDGRDIFNEESKGTVRLSVDKSGNAFINRTYIVQWHAYRFYEEQSRVQHWHESTYPVDEIKRAFDVAETPSLKLPADTTRVFFVGTGKQFQEFTKRHAQKNLTQRVQIQK